MHHVERLMNDSSIRTGTDLPEPTVARLTSGMRVAGRDPGSGTAPSQEACARERMQAQGGRRWRAEYADFMAAYNAILRIEGLPLDKWRTF